MPLKQGIGHNCLSHGPTKPGVKEEYRTRNLPSLFQNGNNISVCFCFSFESSVKRTPSPGLKPGHS